MQLNPSPLKPRKPCETHRSNCIVPAKGTESTAPEKTAAEKMLGKAERTAMLANNETSA